MMQQPEPIDDHAAREALFLEQLPGIERAIASIASRCGWSGDRAEDFGQWVMMRMVEGQYAILAKFQGKSSLSTYLYTVIHNLARDYRIHEHGKWRPSTKARRLGPAAVHLDVLLHRDRRTLEEAIEILRVNERVDQSSAELRALAAELPPHYPRRVEGDERLEERPADDSTESRVRDRDRERATAQAEAALAAALGELEPEDRLMLKLHFIDGFSLADVARRLRLPQKPLYRRREKNLLHLRRSLEKRGIGHEAAAELLGWSKEIRIRWGNSPDGSVQDLKGDL